MDSAVLPAVVKSTSWDPRLDFLQGDQPIRGELCGPEILEEISRKLSTTSNVSNYPVSGVLFRRMRQNDAVLRNAHRELVRFFDRHAPLPPDAEWLLGNFYVIEEVLREVRTDLPRGFYAELPALASGPLKGFPRVYALALALIANTDSSLDESQIQVFVQAYQEKAPLTIGELWSVPTMLRLALLENLRRLAKQVLQSRSERIAAQSWVQKMGATNLPSRQPTGAYVAGLLHALRDLDPVAGAASVRLEEWLDQFGLTTTDALRSEQQRQAADQVSIGNAVTSLRLLAALDWSEFFEHCSIVEARLRTDPTGVYQRQDFATRDNYRRAIEKLARGAERTEINVAEEALSRANETRNDSKRAHLGYYLIDKGRPDFERSLGYRPRWRDALRDAMTSHPRLTYFGLNASILLFVFAAVFPITGSAGLICLALLATLLPASEIAVGLTNHLITILLPPRVLPRLDFRNGVPEEFTTFLVIPSLIAREEHVASLLERLELHYLANPDSNLYFALLTDFADAPLETMPKDEECLAAAKEGIRQLNSRHAGSGPDRFYLFHRRRQWNPCQTCWMGWERKRGKLLEFNRLLRGAGDTSFTVKTGDVSQLGPIRFVLTLDSDTNLPRDSARRLIGVLAHPLNRPQLSPDGRRVVAGYGVLQPRVSYLYRAGFRSLFARLLAGSAGVDPYSLAVSDVYMDLFAAGSFTGKGLYDIDAFEAVTGPAFPDNQILSHDLIESNFARCGLVTDVEVFDDFPARYHAYVRREHRWARGDWQMLPWLGGTVPTSSGARQRNVFPLLERWKLLDNLRRSLTPPAIVTLLILGWTLLPGGPVCWTLLALTALALPLLLQVLNIPISILTGRVGLAARTQLRDSISSTAGHVVLTIAFLADQARLMVDAVARTLYRLFISKRHLLEWETADAAERRLGGHFLHFLGSMGATSALTIAMTALVAWANPAALPVALPILLVWIFSPLIAFFVSLPLPSSKAVLEEPQQRRLRYIVRKTWNFFETFVGPEDHWLPPDNFQEVPKGELAHRTSPTNKGLLLLSTLAAHDLGYLSLPALCRRIGDTLNTLEKLDRYQGHFFNWYDTLTLKPLEPVYISTVDSGNLLGCLLTLKQGLLEKREEQLTPATVIAGLQDTLDQIKLEVDLLRSSLNKDTAVGLQNFQTTLAASGPLMAKCGVDLQNADPFLADLEKQWSILLPQSQSLNSSSSLSQWVQRLISQIQDRREELTSSSRSDWDEDLGRLANRADALASAMSFRFLYNNSRNLFSIGYNVALRKLDQSHYDLLASESCLTSYLVIARNEAPCKHWFQLGRPSTLAGGLPGLISWGGTMFEYLMPRLLLQPPSGTLLDVAYRATVARQIEYGRQNAVPWGISESAFNVLDAQQTYQYQSFGVPGLGLKRGLSKDLVIAPYATLLSLAVDPRAALANLDYLKAEGGEGPYGFYEAIDYTADRLPPGQRLQVIQSYMAHHQGMALLAVANRLLNDPMPRRLMAEPAAHAAELLLQERVPAEAPLIDAHTTEEMIRIATDGGPVPVSRRLTTADTPRPRTLLLSNGTYSVMVTNSGSGSSSCRGLDVTRWRADRTADDWGQYCYIRDLHSGATWSAGHQPLRRIATRYEVIYSIDKAEIRRLDQRINSHLEITVALEKNVEVRRLTLTNLDAKTRELEITSYAEVALIEHAADVSHPAFGKLFLETEWLPAQRALLCRRRPRAESQKPIWAIHVLACEAIPIGAIEYETDRARFLGRRRTPANPVVLDRNAGPLSGTVGAVLDPIFSLRHRVRLTPGGSVTMAFATGVAETREEALALADQFHSMPVVTRAFELAWAHSRVELRHLNLSIEEAHLYQRLAGHVLLPGTALRANQGTLKANRQGQSSLWRYGISGDLPIVLVRLRDEKGLSLVHEMLAVHAYWCAKGLTVDLVILIVRPVSYLEELYEQAQAMVRLSDARDLIDRPGGVYVRKTAQIPDEDQTLLNAAARVVLSSELGSVRDQIDALEQSVVLPPRLGSRRLSRDGEATPSQPAPQANLEFPNGFGGFTPDGKEYVLVSQAAPPPAPWINVIANSRIGFLISDSGSGYTWVGNSQANRLTPWSNDPVSDRPGEVVYMRDEDTGEIWSPTPLPVLGAAPTTIRHGQGYSVFSQPRGGLEQELTLFVPPHDKIKIVRLALRNRGSSALRLSATFYAELVLGPTTEQVGLHIVTEQDAASGIVLARNAFNAAYSSAVAFADVTSRPHTVTGDRTEFLGRNGSVAAPAALQRTNLSGRTGAGLDACAAIQTKLELAAGETREVVFLLGQENDADAARNLVERYRCAGEVEKAFQATVEDWDRLLNAVQVKTPDKALDLLLNRWLLYQVTSCRLWGRSAFYQSGGAYGFRDQLQDVASLLDAAPAKPGSKFCGPLRANLSKEMSSTGGIRRPGAAFARAVPTIFSGSSMSPPNMSM